MKKLILLLALTGCTGPTWHVKCWSAGQQVLEREITNRSIVEGIIRGTSENGKLVYFSGTCFVEEE